MTTTTSPLFPTSDLLLRFGPGHEHTTDATAAYRVVRTDWTAGMGEGLVRRLIARVVPSPGWGNYDKALVQVERVRADAGPSQYGVIDTEYRCGCVV